MVFSLSDSSGQILVVLIWLTLVGGLSEGLRRLGYGGELTRKIVHIGAGHVMLLAWWFAIPAWMGIACAVVASLVSLASYRLPILPGINSIGRKSLGTFFYAVSIGVLVAWFWPLQLPFYGVIGILIMCWGDGLAALVGRRWGKHGYCLLREAKSWEGSLTMLVVSFVVVCAVLIPVQGMIAPTWWVALCVAGFATGLEAVSYLGIDNLTVPVGAAAIAYWLNTGLTTIGLQTL
jgi:phytol kinase